MLKKLRWKFIAAAMLSLLGVMAALLLSINLISTRYFTSLLDSELDQLERWTESSQRLGSNIPGISSDFSFNKKNIYGEIEPGALRPQIGAIRPSELPWGNGNLPSSYFYVRFNSDGTIDEVNTDKITDVTYADAVEYAVDVTENEKTDGSPESSYTHSYKGSYKSYRYMISRRGEIKSVYFLSSGYVNYSLRMFRLISCLTAAGSCFLVFVLVVIFSGRAVRPVAESYEKQKRFITDAGHELKTPITIVSANNELMRMNYGPSEWADGTADQIKRMSELVGRLVELSRLDEEKPPVTRADFSLSDAVTDTSSAFYGAAERAGKSLELHIAPDVRYRGDEGAIRELNSILLDNAVKYCDIGGTIAIRLTGGRRPVLTVSNPFKNVAGLELDKLFDRFYRADKARTGGGYGLGLSIAKSIAAAHKADIRAVNAGGDVICFEVKL